MLLFKELERDALQIYDSDVFNHTLSEVICKG